MKITIEEGLRGLIFVAASLILGVDNRRNSPDVDFLVNSVVEEAKSKFNVDSLKDDPIIRAYRDFYWRQLGIDPTKQRPAQEALLRRVLRGEGLPRISPMVDIGNAASVKYLVPIGLYDLDSFGWEDLVFRRAREGEEFRPIGSPSKRLSQSQIVLSTISGRILHVYPYRDSEDTKVKEDTKNVLAIAAGVPGVDGERLMEALRLIGDMAVKALGASRVVGPVLIRDDAVLIP